MISGSVAVEGGAARPFPGGGSEFLRPLPRAPPYGRAPPPALTLPGPDSDIPSTAPAYPPVPGAYARFLPHFYSYPSYHQLPQPPSPLPPSPTQAQLQQVQLQQSQLQRESLQRELQRERESLLQRDREAFQLQRERETAAAVAHQTGAPPHQQPIAPPPPPSPPARPAPRGKEGSLKHRFLPRDRSTPVGRFSRGALIQLGGGQLRRVEDMRTEDFVMSAERSPEVKLVDSTVVKLIRRPATDSVTLTLSYNGNTEVDVESAVEHPFFVYGQGWASCSPERTMQCYGLQVNRLQVGDVCVSLVPREPPLPLNPPLPPPPAHHHGSQTIVTTATTTAMTVRPMVAPQRYPENLSLREDSRKRRSSAPDVVGEDNIQRPRTMARH